MKIRLVSLCDYLHSSLRLDLFAGFTVAMVAIPQAMAYAAIVGVPPIHGLYAAILPVVIGALSGSFRFLVTGPTNATALVTASVLVAVAGRTDYLEFVFALAVFAGIFKLILGVLKLGWIVRYVSNSVLIGFLAGASILIVLSQLGNLLGLPRTSNSDTLTILSESFNNLGRLNPYVITVGAITIGGVLVFKRISKHCPAELVAMGVAASLVLVTGWHSNGVHLVGDLGSLSNAGLEFHVPTVSPSDWGLLVPSAGAVALFSLVEAMSIAKAVSLSSGEQLNASREFVAQGLASIVGGFFQSIPASGSPSRTAVNAASGAQTQMASAFSGGFVLLSLLAFAPLLNYIPLTCLAAIVTVSVSNLVNRHQFMVVWRSSLASRAIVFVTFSATLFWPLHLAIYLGVALSIAVYLYNSGTIRLGYLIENGAGKFSERRFEDLLAHPPPIAIINVEGALYFGAAEDLEQRLDVLFRSGVRVAILRMRRVSLLDSTGATTLERVAVNAKRCGTHLLLCGVRADVARVLESSGLNALMGEENIFKADDTLFESTYLALERAKKIAA